MSWSALTLGEVAGLFTAAGAVALWLYLRQPRAARLRVSTLRFWESSPSGSSTARRWKLREPLAFIAQLLFLLLLIAAFGNPRWGIVTHGRDVAIVLDAGAWSQMRGANGISWVEGVRSRADALLRDLPSDDRIVLLRADSDGAPMVPFTTDRGLLRQAVANMQSSSAVADVPRALAQGRAALGESDAMQSAVRRGLLVYIGPGLVDDKQARELDDFRVSLGPAASDTAANNATAVPPEFLVRLVSTPAPLQDIGITQIALKRNSAAPDEWSVMTRIKNYNDLPAKVLLSLSVGGHVFQQVPVSIAPGATQSASDDFTSRSGGLLQAEITPTDGLDADNRATIDLPSSEPVSVAVVTSRAAFASKMRAVLSANPYVKTTFVRAEENPPSTADVVVYDGPVPAGATGVATISFMPAGADSTAHRVRLANWNTAHPVTRWIQSRDVTVRAAHSLQTQPGDVALASSSGQTPEPLIVARQESRRRSVLLDFDPLDSNFTE
jgi:aerotolerance regulator-like protein